jgi:hypothetical protein
MMAATTLTNGMHQPAKEDGRPDKDNFGAAAVDAGKEQSTFARQCWCNQGKVFWYNVSVQAMYEYSNTRILSDLVWVCMNCHIYLQQM